MPTTLLDYLGAQTAEVDDLGMETCPTCRGACFMPTGGVAAWKVCGTCKGVGKVDTVPQEVKAGGG